MKTKAAALSRVYCCSLRDPGSFFSCIILSSKPKAALVLCRRSCNAGPRLPTSHPDSESNVWPFSTTAVVCEWSLNTRTPVLWLRVRCYFSELLPAEQKVENSKISTWLVHFDHCLTSGGNESCWSSALAPGQHLKAFWCLFLWRCNESLTLLM